MMIKKIIPFLILIIIIVALIVFLHIERREAENLVFLRERVNEIEMRFGYIGVEHARHLEVLESKLVDIEGRFSGKVDGLRGEIDGLRGKMVGLGDLLRGEIEGLRGEIEGLREEMEGLIGEIEVLR